MSKEVRVGSLAQVTDLVYGDGYQNSLGLVVIITGVDSLRNAPGMLSQLADMVESNDWCIADKSWMDRIVEISRLLSEIFQCLQQLGDNIQEGGGVEATVGRLRGFQEAVQYLIDGPLPREIRGMLCHLRTLLDRRFSTSNPVFHPMDLQQQAHQTVAELLNTALECPTFTDGPKLKYFTFEKETTQLLNMLSDETCPLSDFQKSIFLDELISNSCYSLDMVKHRTEHAVSPSLYIEIVINKEKNTFTVRDTGVGMTRADITNKLINGSRRKIKRFMKSADDGVTLTNEFGIGFLSTYFVANKVVVTTKHANDEQYIYEARSNTAYTISPDNDGKSLGRGTKVTIYLKPDQGSYLDLHYVTEHVKKCATLFDHDVYLVVENSATVFEAEVVESARVPTAPEVENLKLMSGLTPGCNIYRFQLIKDKPVVHKRNNEVGELEQRKKRRVQQ